MPTAIIYLDEEIDSKIINLSKELKISKHDVIVRILNEKLKQKGGINKKLIN